MPPPVLRSSDRAEGSRRLGEQWDHGLQFIPGDQVSGETPSEFAGMHRGTHLVETRPMQHGTCAIGAP